MKTYRIQTIKNQACKSHKCIQFGTLRKKKPERTIKQKKRHIIDHLLDMTINHNIQRFQRQRNIKHVIYKSIKIIIHENGKIKIS